MKSNLTSFSIGGIDFLCDYDYFPAEKETYNDTDGGYPGSPAGVEFNSICLQSDQDENDILEFLSQSTLAQLEEKIIMYESESDEG